MKLKWVGIEMKWIVYMITLISQTTVSRPVLLKFGLAASQIINTVCAMHGFLSSCGANLYSSCTGQVLVLQWRQLPLLRDHHRRRRSVWFDWAAEEEPPALYLPQGGNIWGVFVPKKYFVDSYHVYSSYCQGRLWPLPLVSVPLMLHCGSCTSTASCLSYAKNFA